MRYIRLPEDYGYIAVFLTFACPYKCSYCINRFGEAHYRRKVISGKDWVKALGRIDAKDVPITLSGGEPSSHPDFIYIINHLPRRLDIDILTNLSFDLDEFIEEVDPNRLRRDAPYASIRASYHPEVMDLRETIDKTIKLMKAGFSIGLYGVLHPIQEEHILEAQKECLDLGIDFKVKPFLGYYQGRLYGQYRYEGACRKKFRKKVLCRISELIIGTEGSVYRCHHDLYEGKEPVGSIIEQDFEIEDEFRECDDFGFCNPCDVKVKSNRFQQFGHTSTEMREYSPVLLNI